MWLKLTMTLVVVAVNFWFDFVLAGLDSLPCAAVQVHEQLSAVCCRTRSSMIINSMTVCRREASLVWNSCCGVQLVRRWKLGSLAPADADALFCHNYNVRSLSAGCNDILVSGDSSGEIAIWQV